MSMKNSNDTIGDRPRDLPACSAVPQPTAPPCAPKMNSKNVNIVQYTWVTRIWLPLSHKKYVTHGETHHHLGPCKVHAYTTSRTVWEWHNPTTHFSDSQQGVTEGRCGNTTTNNEKFSVIITLCITQKDPQNYRPKQLSWFLVKNTLLLVPLVIKNCHTCSNAKKCDAD